MTDQKNMTGVLFKNDKKETDAHPDYTGNATVRGEELRLAAWVNKSKTGRSYMSVKFTEPQERKTDETDVPF